MTAAILNARWIWCDANTAEVNQYGLFRRLFELPAGHGPVRAHACADSRYWLYINGRRVGSGPGRFNERFPQYDTYDITEFVRAGGNVIAFKVHAIGPVTEIRGFIPTRAALAAAVEWEGGGVVSDATWRTQRERAYAADTPRLAPRAGFAECFDARAAAAGWEQVGFEDFAWASAFELPPDALAPWQKLVPRPVPNLTLVPRLPARVIESGRTVTGDGPGATVERRPADLVCADPARLFPLLFKAPADGRDAAYAMIDFAESAPGCLTFHLEGAPGVTVDFQCIERADSAPHGADRVILNGRALEHTLMYPKRLRRLLVEVRGGEARLLGVRQEVSTYPVEWRGTFACLGDPALARIREAGVRCVQQDMEDIYVDACAERGRWPADLAPEAMAAYYAFGETELAKHSLDLFMGSQQPVGYLAGRCPGRGLADSPMESAGFAPALADYVRYSGDRAFPRQTWDGVRRITRWFEAQRTAEDLLVMTSAPAAGSLSGLNMLYCRYLADASWVAKLIGEASESRQLQRLARRTKKAVQQLLFDEASGLFAAGREAAGPAARAAVEENLLALFWGIAAREQVGRIDGALFPDDRPLPPDVGRAIGAPAFIDFAVGALFEIGRAAKALNTIRAHEARRAAAVCAGRYLLGVEPVSPGFRTFSVYPTFAGLAGASGRVPTPHGVIAVAWQREEEGARLVVDVPEKTRALAGLPLHSRNVRLWVDGRKIRAAVIPLRRGEYAAGEIDAGRHELRLEDR